MWAWLPTGALRWPSIMVLTWGAVELTLRLRLAFRSGLTHTAGRWMSQMRGRLREWTFFLLIGSIGAAVVGALGLAQLGSGGTVRGPGPVVAGAMIASAGLALRVWSILTLDRLFTFVVGIADDHRVVQDGPYRIMRHPGYAGVLLVLIGIGVATGDWLSLAVIVVIPALALSVRIAVEEAALTAALGAQYVAYADRTARLLPGIW